jgi:transcriptional regulator with XRE-family HTH domain
MDVMRLLGQRIAAGRQRKGWSQTELAHRAGVPQVTVWRLENDKLRNVSVVVVRRIARALDLDVDYLVGTREPDVELEPAKEEVAQHAYSPLAVHQQCRNTTGGGIIPVYE